MVAETPVQEQVITYLCPKCGTETQFPPGTPKPYCKHCEGEVGAVPGGKNIVSTVPAEAVAESATPAHGAAYSGETTDDRDKYNKK